MDQGEGIIFANRYRPVAGARGHYRVNVRHGVSTLRAGERYALGIIFFMMRAEPFDGLRCRALLLFSFVEESQSCRFSSAMM